MDNIIVYELKSPIISRYGLLSENHKTISTTFSLMWYNAIENIHLGGAIHGNRRIDKNQSSQGF